MDQTAFEAPTAEIDTLPLKPMGWRVLIRPYTPARHTAGGIELAEETIESEELLTYVGQVVALGEKCFQAKTRSGIDMSTMELKCEVGDWVMYGTYGGQTVRMKGGGRYLLTNDDAIMAIVRDPADFKYYL